MEDSLFRKIIDECSTYDVERIIPYLMADPLTDRKIFKRIEYIRRKMSTVEIEISTTAKHLSREVAERIFDSSITEMRISSFGITQNDYVKYMPGNDFEQAKERIDYFINEFHRIKPAFRFYVVVLDGLLEPEAQQRVHDYWKERNIDVYHWYVTSRGKQVDTEKCYLPENQKIRLVSPVKRLQASLCRFMGIHPKPMYWCNRSRDTAWSSILYNGDVCLCCMDYHREVILGNVREHTLKDVWGNPVFCRARDMVAGIEESAEGFLCNRCEWHAPLDKAR